MSNCPVCGRPNSRIAPPEGASTSIPNKSLKDMYFDDVRDHTVRHAVLFFLGLLVGSILSRWLGMP